MLDFFAIFSKGGIVLWCFQGAAVTESFTGPVNALIRSVILQERSGNTSFTHNALSLKYKLDNEFELVFVVGFQKILTLTYVDKFIDDVQLYFRDRYKNELEQRGALKFLLHNYEFGDDFHRLLREAEESCKAKAPVSMRTFNESQKSQKTVKSMIETKEGDKSKVQGGKKSKNAKKEAESKGEQAKVPSQVASKKAVENGNEGLTPEEIIERKRAKFISKQLGGGKVEKTSKSPKPQKTKEKVKRVWDMGGKSTGPLDYSGTNGNNSSDGQTQDKDFPEPLIQVDSMKGDLRGVDYESSDEEEEEVEEQEERVVVENTDKKGAKKGGFGGMFGMLKGLVGSKNLTQEDMEPVLDKMRDHLIAKNVAAEIASQLCDSVAKKLEGKVMGTFTTVASTVKQALQESLVQILQPKRRVDILRDVLEARSQHKPFVITFCGVNGVGKSTNLAKISYWLIENGFTVLIAACDTFRAGAVEQLRTHQRRLNSLHPPEKHGGCPAVQLFEKGYGKDAAGIAMEAVAFARNQGFDVVLIDTAGRMQDNAPLMTALAKLIAVNTPDLVLFVGEALVGNEAVDQLVKFNQALADHSKTDKPRLIDGIVLTKFDTIDDKVGAAVSMTYITGQPIVFVGTGQTYSDLRSLNARAVVSALMKA
ncbi:signal recognition particle receptor subunit alpha [Xyrauchen texanus]|uniref:signal recognition particle receptor subunit alpha n=1 Tax=Xyrauchen texanus TaxID=154827 RepID=UPI002241E5C4|nr:signal recognition particle receptor subunit alpha [Xyrauchen texanus]XP_051953648.1 signal recognition particle receptor subunit alpha [Xyrauchen texanus]XP_051953650.1 signal recognition particle receptor subunit alpha [Xyrauchen texanus]